MSENAVLLLPRYQGIIKYLDGYAMKDRGLLQDELERICWLIDTVSFDSTLEFRNEIELIETCFVKYSLSIRQCLAALSSLECSRSWTELGSMGCMSNCVI
jgi:hypothetical protein